MQGIHDSEVFYKDTSHDTLNVNDGMFLWIVSAEDTYIYAVNKLLNNYVLVLVAHSYLD